MGESLTLDQSIVVLIYISPPNRDPLHAGLSFLLLTLPPFGLMISHVSSDLRTSVPQTRTENLSLRGASAAA